MATAARESQGRKTTSSAISWNHHQPSASSTNRSCRPTHAPNCMKSVRNDRKQKTPTRTSRPMPCASSPDSTAAPTKSTTTIHQATAFAASSNRPDRMTVASSAGRRPCGPLNVPMPRP